MGVEQQAREVKVSGLLKEAEEEFDKSRRNGAKASETNIVWMQQAEYAEGIYHGIRALYHQNAALIELLKR